MGNELIGVFGGSFNPIHNGHLRMAEEAKVNLGLSKVIFLPNFLQPLKDEPGATPEQRLEMINLAIKNNSSFELSDYELKQGKSCYTVDTLDHFNKEFGDNLWFIMGSDSWEGLRKWKEYMQIFCLANILVAGRYGEPWKEKWKTMEDVLFKHEAAQFSKDIRGVYTHQSGKKVKFISIFELELSSTDIRDMVFDGDSIRYLVPDEVKDYIERTKLYVDVNIDSGTSTVG
jgi:nicotinate-nucleotide adenylyltransferase